MLTNCIVAGKTFRSLTEARAHYNVPASSFERRRRAGWNLEQCLGIEAPPLTDRKSYNLWLRANGHEERVCSKCGAQKPLTEYYGKSEGQTGDYGSRCKECIKIDVREGSRLREYGITPSEWQALFDSQGRVCAICGGDEPQGNEWHTDHCHTTNQVRGILCRPCNLMLGYARDNKDTLLKAIQYLG